MERDNPEDSRGVKRRQHADIKPLSPIYANSDGDLPLPLVLPPSLTEAVHRFREAARAELRKLQAQGVPLEEAASVLFEKLQTQPQYNLRQEDLRLVMEKAHFLEEAAIRTLILREELSKLRVDGKPPPDSVHALIQRLQQLNPSFPSYKKRKVIMEGTQLPSSSSAGILSSSTPIATATSAAAAAAPAAALAAVDHSPSVSPPRASSLHKRSFFESAPCVLPSKRPHLPAADDPVAMVLPTASPPPHNLPPPPPPPPPRSDWSEAIEDESEHHEDDNSSLASSGEEADSDSIARRLSSALSRGRGRGVTVASPAQRKRQLLRKTSEDQIIAKRPKPASAAAAAAAAATHSLSPPPLPAPHPYPAPGSQY
jgi:hypothetical protein